jgi:site-specific DNA-methyltransferase (adenine-specific)
MKPMSKKGYVDQALQNGKGITWLGDCRIPYKPTDAPHAGNRTATFGSQKTVSGGDGSPSYTPANEGRFPANLVISDEVLNDGKNHPGGGIGGRNKHGRGEGYGFKPLGENTPDVPKDNGGYSRFFSLDAWTEKNLPFLIVPKPTKKEKNEGLGDFEEKSVNDGRKKPINNPFQRGTTPNKNTHPCVKPLKLMSYLITMGSRENDVVLDCFAGSGSTLLAAKMLKRRFIGFELDKEYHRIATHRIENAEIKKAA